MDKGAWWAIVHGSTHHVLASANSAALNTGLHVSFHIRIISGYMLRSGIAGLYGNSMFSFLRNLHKIGIKGAIKALTWGCTLEVGMQNVL